MLYNLHELPLDKLLSPCVRATEALARLDERVSRSPFKAGFLERQDFMDSASSLWIDGELVHVEDLVLHDAHMDVRAPTHEMRIANLVLRTRRQIITNAPSWALSAGGLARLRRDENPSETPKVAKSETTDLRRELDDEDGDLSLDEEISAIDRLIARSSATLEAVTANGDKLQPDRFDNFTRDPDWNEEERLEEWSTTMKASSDFPAVLRAAIAIDAWQQLDVLQRSSWLGRQLAAAILREQSLTQHYLPSINTGLRATAREKRYSRSQTERLVAFMDSLFEAATSGLKEHDRLSNARSRMERRLVGRRSNSRLSELIELVLAKPVVSTAMIVKMLGTTPQGAVGLAKELELREVTGRGRFRAWGIL